jgi:plastocyanin
MSVRLGTILLALLCLTACSGSGLTTSPTPTPTPTPAPAPSPAPTGTTASVSIVNGASLLSTTAYSPNPLNVSVGTTVTWKNNDSTTHDSTAVNGSFATGSIAPGGSMSVKFQSAGTFQYFCTIHPGMVGTITVQ